LPKFGILLLCIMGILLTACADGQNPSQVWAETESIALPSGLAGAGPDETEESGGENSESQYPEEMPLANPSAHTIPEDLDPENDGCFWDIPVIECETELMDILPTLYEKLGRRPMIALTFDDGPGPLTAYVVEMLERYGGVATFCVIGNRVERWSDIILKTVEAGNEVIGHSWNHQNLTLLREAAIAAQILDTSAAIEAVTGFPPPSIFRAPYGLVNTRVRNVAEELGYSMLNWTIDPEDWRNRDAGYIHAHIMAQARDGAIVLLHDIHPTTVEAMERVIPDLIEKGFQLVTATYLIEYFYGGLEPRVEYRGLRPGETVRSNDEIVTNPDD